MTKKTKRYLMLSILILFCGFIALNILAINHSHAMMYFSDRGCRTTKPELLSLGEKIRVLIMGVNLPRPESTRTPAELDLPFEERLISCANGVRLAAWYIPSSGSQMLVILFHGYGTDKASLLDEAGALHDLGYSVLLVDFRGSGGSSEDYTSLGYVEAEDVTEATRYARNNLPYHQIVLSGYSMGAVAILRAVHEYDIDPSGIICEAVFGSMRKTVKNRFEAMKVPSFPSADLLVFWGGRQFGFNGFKHNPVEYARSVSCPILFMHGSDDPRARIKDARQVFDVVSARKEFKEFPETGHEEYIARFPLEWEETVGRFLTQVMQKPMRRSTD
jgi:uncharacterized protein